MGFSSRALISPRKSVSPDQPQQSVLERIEAEKMNKTLTGGKGFGNGREVRGVAMGGKGCGNGRQGVWQWEVRGVAMGGKRCGNGR